MGKRGRRSSNDQAKAADTLVAARRPESTTPSPDWAAELTEQRRIAQRIDQLGRALDRSSMAFFIADTAGRMVYANPTFARRSETLVDGPIAGRSVFELFPTAQAVWDDILPELDRHGQWNGRVELDDREGVVHSFEAWVARHEDDLTAESNVVVSLVDATAASSAERALRTNAELLSRAQALTHLGSWNWDIETGALTWTDEVFHIFGTVPSEFGATYEAFLAAVHPDDRATVESAVATAVSELGSYDVEHRVLRPDGSVRHVHERGEVIVDGNGNAARLVGIVHDVTEQYQHIAAITASERQVRAVLNAMAARTIVVDDRGVITAVNEAWLESPRVWGITQDLGIGESYLAATDEGVSRDALGAQAVALGLRDVLSGAINRFAVDFSCDRPDGTMQWFMLTAEALDAPTGGAVLSERDITERKRAEAQLRHLALHDSLTGLPNRQLILDRIRHATRHPRRSTGWLAVMLLDLDRFKIVNDSLGHASGDQVLIDVAERITRAVRPGDTVGRLGGDEFIIVCDDLDSADQAGVIATRVLAALERPHHIAGRDLYLRASIGIAVCSGSGSGSDADALVRNADAAMYIAKGHGGHRVSYFDDLLRQRSVQRLDLEHDLRGALDRNQLRLEYQPQRNLRTGELVGFEALARWNHPLRGEIPPSDFIPIAEESDLIAVIGRWTLDEACRQLAAWDAQHGTDDLRVAINVSARQLVHHGIAESVADALARHRLAPQRLELEITETAFLDQLELLSVVLHQLAALGVRIALDDFGTGSASLSHVSQLPLHALKIDRTFVHGLTTGNRGARAIATSVLAIAHAFALDVTAEGIETPGQLACLRELGCELGQGYLLGRPTHPDSIGQSLGHPRQLDLTASGHRS